MEIQLLPCKQISLVRNNPCPGQYKFSIIDVIDVVAMGKGPIRLILLYSPTYCLRSIIQDCP